MSNLGQVLTSSRWGKSDRIFDNNLFTGVEVELEGLSYNRFVSNNVQRHYSMLLQNWKAVEDGSLQEGIEFTFSEPLKGNVLNSSLHGLHKFIRDYGNIRATQRCGVHVHLDVRDLDAAGIINLVLVYMLFERCIYACVDPDRFKTTFCRPLCSSDFKRLIVDLIKASNNESQTQDKMLAQLINLANSGSVDKYSGLNLRTIATYGSVEFRMHQGTTDIEGLAGWINVLHCLYGIASQYHITQLIEMYEKDPSTFNGLFNKTTLNIAHLPDLTNKGFREVSRILSAQELDKIHTSLISDEYKGAGKLPVVLADVIAHNNRSLMRKRKANDVDLLSLAS